MPRALADIDADLTAAYAARRAAMNSKSYGRDGMNKTSQDLSALNATINELQAERSTAALGLTGRPFVGGMIR